ncbi:Ig-like domain-containing protein, partial [Okeania sp. KiyG1]|uniref:Ig-like domain-containing protein n=1 Tax=Okeania sp. KiyG1 TaxID=2720165 RepID=UPI001F38AF9F
MLSNDELNIFKTDSLTVSGLVNNNDNEFNFPQPLLSSEDTFTVLPLDEETLRFSSQLIDDIEVNTIEGTPGRDNLVGTEGDDIIIGFQGRDTITGGDGNDTFLYTSIIDAGDIITDFEVGQDKIDFTEVLDGMGLTGDDPIESGYVGFRTYETDVIVTIHPNGAAGRRRSFLRLQGLADDAVDNESFLADVLGLNSDIEVPVISAELLNDTGEDDSDGITSDPTIIGTINTESEVVSLTAGFNETSVEDFVDVTAALLEDGSFELNQELLENVLGDTLTNGTYSLKLQATDSGGNLSEVIEFEFTFDLDVSVPIVSAELLNDTGEDDSDGITSDPTIIGTINTESEVVSLTAGFNETSVEDFVDVTAALLEDGSFELNQELLENVLGDTLTNGTYSLKLQATDSGGNLSEVIEFEFTFDLDVSVPIVSAELLNDTGEDDSDGITSDPTIIGTINTESEVVSLTAGFNETSVEDFVDVTAALLEDGSFELNQELLENVLGDTLTNGTYSLKLQATDSGGNLSEVIEFEFTFDLDVSVPIVSAELLNDTGEDDSDGITSDPTIIGTINTESEVVSLTAGFNETSVEDFVDVTAALLEDGSFELNQELLENVLGDTLTNGTYSLKLQATDSGGNLSEVIEFEFTFDLDVSVPIVSAELLNDTGEDDSDGITSDPTIIGTINTESEVVSLTAGFNETSVEDFVDVTAALLEDGSFELNQELLENVLGDTLTNGTYSLKLQATDSGGNLSEVIEFEFTFDLDVSVPIVSAELLNDTGEDDSDGITSDPTIIGTINTESEVVSLTAGFNETSVEDFVDVTAALLEDGSFELNQELLENVLGDTLTNGTYSLKLQATDSGGNLSEVIEFEFTFDLDVSVPIVSAELLNDTGEDDSDGITSDPTIIGTINTESEVVSLTAGFNETSVEDFVDVTAALLEDGSFELNQELLENVLGDTLTNGTYSLKLQATDSGGNLSEVIEFEFTFDLDVSVPIVSAELLNDTGGDDSDGITSDPTIIGTINTESEVVSLTAGFNETSVEDFVDVTAALLEDGSFELNQELLENVLGDTLTNGTYSLKLQATDSGGNLSEVIEFEFTFDLDVSVPIVSAELLNDTGEDDSDNITSDPTIIGTINAESEIVSLTAGFNDTLSEDFVDVTAALLEDGSFELDQELLEDVFGDTLTNGTYTLKLQATDTDGNLSEVIEFEFTLNIDSPIISVELLNDTGEDNTDNITSDSTIVGTINIENEVVSLTAGFNETSPEDFVDVTAALLEDGTFELNQELLEDVFGDTLTNGTYNLKLQATDSGGNLSEIVEFEFTLDLDVEVPIISAELASDTGADDSDGITSDPTIIGTVNTESEVVSLTAGFNETPPEDFVDITDALLEDGTFELNQELLEDILGDILTDGTYTLKLQVTDSDGNLSEIVEFEFTLDSEASEISVELANDTGADDSDGITSDPTIIGTINTDSEIVSLTAGFNDTLEEDFVDITDALSEDGTFELDQELLEDILGETLTNDTYFLNLQSTGSNGIASEIVEFEFTLDTVAPEIFIELANDTGESDTDKLTAEPTIIANILDGSDIVSLTGNFNNNSTEEFIDLTPLLEIDGSLELTPEFLEEMLGDVLTDGTYTLYLQAVDEHNISSDVIEFEFTFSEAEIDRPGPEILSLAEIYGLDTYPDAITLPNTGTRQLSVKVDGWLDSPELTIDIADISYTVADENVLSVNDEGLVTATGVGETTVTVEYGDASATIPVLVDEPEPGATIVDENGGIVSGSDGELVMIPPESFLQETSVNITSKNSQELSLDIPENYSFVTGFELEIGDQPINHPVQLAIPAPEDVEAGTEVFFMVKGEIPDAEGNLNETWVVQESGIVGEDGIIRTQSPPWQGVQLSGEYSVVIPNFEYSVAHIELALASTVAGTVLVGAGVASIAVASRVSALQNSALQQSRKIGKINPLFFGQRGLDLIGFGVDTLATVPVLINAAEKSVTAITIPQVGLPYETESGVQLNPGQFCCSSLTVDLPTPPAPDAL